MTIRLPLPQDVADILVATGPSVVDARGTIHADTRCRVLAKRATSIDRAALVAAGARVDGRLVAPCLVCGTALVSWLGLVHAIHENLQLVAPCTVLGREVPLVDRDFTTGAWANPSPGHDPAPHCCRVHLPEHDPVNSTLTASQHARVEALLAQAVHDRITADDPYAGHERPTALLVTHEILNGPSPIPLEHYWLLCTQHAWAGTTREHSGPGVSVFHLPDTAATDIAASLPHHALTLPAHDLDESAWRVLAALVSTQYPHDADLENRDLGAALPQLLATARTATA